MAVLAGAAADTAAALAVWHLLFDPLHGTCDHFCAGDCGTTCTHTRSAPSIAWFSTPPDHDGHRSDCARQGEGSDSLLQPSQPRPRLCELLSEYLGNHAGLAAVELTADSGPCHWCICTVRACSVAGTASVEALAPHGPGAGHMPSREHAYLCSQPLSQSSRCVSYAGRPTADVSHTSAHTCTDAHGAPCTCHTECRRRPCIPLCTAHRCPTQNARHHSQQGSRPAGRPSSGLHPRHIIRKRLHPP